MNAAVSAAIFRAAALAVMLAVIAAGAWLALDIARTATP